MPRVLEIVPIITALLVVTVAVGSLVQKARARPQETESANVSQLGSIIDAMQKLADELRKELERSQDTLATTRAEAITAREEAIAKIEQLEAIIVALRADIVTLEAQADHAHEAAQ